VCQVRSAAFCEIYFCNGISYVTGNAFSASNFVQQGLDNDKLENGVNVTSECVNTTLQYKLTNSGFATSSTEEAVDSDVLSQPIADDRLEPRCQIKDTINGNYLSIIVHTYFGG
jgi:hypothetical protein